MCLSGPLGSDHETWEPAHPKEAVHEPGCCLQSPLSTLEVICEVFVVPKLLIPCLALTRRLNWVHPVKFSPDFLRKRQCFLLISSQSILRSADKTEPEGRALGILEVFSLWSPHTDPTPFLCEGASLAIVMSPLPWTATSTRDKGPKPWSSELPLNATPSKSWHKYSNSHQGCSLESLELSPGHHQQFLSLHENETQHLTCTVILQYP